MCEGLEKVIKNHKDERIYYLENYTGIYFINYSGLCIHHLLGDHHDYIKARKMIDEHTKNWTNDDYDNMLSGSHDDYMKTLKK